MSFKVKDHYYKKAKKENFLARSIYKLEEVDKKYQVLSPGDSVIDLGYFPGSWIQYTSTKVGKSGRVVGTDIKPVSKDLSHLKNVSVFEQDAFDINLLEHLGLDEKVDVLLSDMAPNTTGIRSVDQDRSLALVEKVFELAKNVLRPNGNLVVKVFDSNDAQVYLKSVRKNWDKFFLLKPKSTRSVSKEFFAIGKGYKIDT